jgi:hypothetical protein
VHSACSVVPYCILQCMLMQGRATKHLGLAESLTRSEQRKSADFLLLAKIFTYSAF